MDTTVFTTRPRIRTQPISTVRLLHHTGRIINPIDTFTVPATMAGALGQMSLQCVVGPQRDTQATQILHDRVTTTHDVPSIMKLTSTMSIATGIDVEIAKATSTEMSSVIVTAHAIHINGQLDAVMLPTTSFHSDRSAS